MNTGYHIFGESHLELEAPLALGILLATVLFTGSASAGVGTGEHLDLFTATERAEKLGKDAELELYSKVLRATQGRGTYRLLIKTAQECDRQDGTSG